MLVLLRAVSDKVAARNCCVRIEAPASVAHLDQCSNAAHFQCLLLLWDSLWAWWLITLGLGNDALLWLRFASRKRTATERTSTSPSIMVCG